MTAALGPVATLLGKVFSMLSQAPVAAYVDSLELGHNSEQIKAKLAHTRGLLHNAQVSDVRHNPGLQDLLPALSRNADQAEDLLDELHYFQIHDKLHGTNYATTQEAGPVLGGAIRDGRPGSVALHARTALRHTVGSLLQCFSCSDTQDGGDDSALAVTQEDGGATNSATDELHFDRVSMSRRIKSVLQDMQSNCDFVSDLLGSIPINSDAVAINRPQIGSTIVQDTLYGRRRTFEQTVNRITNDKETVSVLPIVGPGGIGKTTFTQHIYNDARAKNHFEVRVWICVSTDFNVLKLTKEILGCIPATENEGSSSIANETTNLDQLQLSIEHRLMSKRFLIILDDIWKCGSENQWKTLLAPFTKGGTKGSIVVVTTRFPKVADMVKTFDSLELRGLESDDFFTLFEAYIFGNHKPEDYEFELAGVAREIAAKLKGSPLAAKTVGRLLHKDLSQEHWNGILDNREWLNQKNDDDIMPSLKISYDYLPFDLKKCFSYFGLYPEDYLFGNSEMNHLFVAIGIIEYTQQGDRNYLEELVENGFLMRRGYNYVLHDLMHELCRSVSVEECLNISGLDFRANTIPRSVRHLSITIQEKYDTKFEEEMNKLRWRISIASLRTLMIFGKYEERIAKILKDCYKEINSLRVLFIEVNSPEYFPHRFSKLIHLRYLKIRSANKVTLSLPSTLSRFYHLKFLDLDDWHGSSDLPEDFSHLTNLHVFCAKSELHSNIRNVGKIEHLQELKEFHVKKEIMGFELAELGALEELEGELIIRGLKNVATKEEAAAAKLVLKMKLKELKLLWDRDQPTVDADILDALKPHSNLRAVTIANPTGTIGPSWLCLDIWLTSLETLTLECVSWSTLPPFGKLTNLKVLTLKRIDEMRQFGLRCGGAPRKCFLRLKEVGFHDMPDLADWVLEPDCHSYPSLEIVECVNCPNLHGMPFSEVSCTNMCILKVSGCPKMSLPSMPHTSTLTYLVVKGAGSQILTYDGKKLVVNGHGGTLVFRNLDKVEDMTIEDASHILFSDIEKLKVLKELAIGRCDGLFPVDLDVSVAFRSVKHLTLDASHLTSKSSSKVLNCFPALSVLIILSHRDYVYKECVMHLPSSSSLQTLRFSYCMGLVLVPVENGGGILGDNSSLHTLTINRCDKFFSRWPMGEAGGGAQTSYPFPASLRELSVYEMPSMKSMALLSNLTSLTSLTLYGCSNLIVDGFNPLTAANLKVLYVVGSNTVAADLLSEVARTKLLPAGSFRLERLTVDDISGLLVAPICNLLAPALRTLEFNFDRRAEIFTEEQAEALQLLTSLQILRFAWCDDLQSLPQGLHRLSSLKELTVCSCPKIQSMPKEGFPIPLRRLQIYPRSVEKDRLIEKIKSTNPDLTISY